MAKITPSTISSGYQSTTQLNNNFTAIASELNNKVLYRNNPTGEPNSMQNDLDMSGNQILNVPTPTAPTDVVRLQDLSTTGVVNIVGIATDNTIQNLRDRSLVGVVPTNIVYVKYYSSLGDGGHGNFRYTSGAAPGTYTDNGGTIIVPTGGDGSAAWLRQYTGPVNVRWFGAKGDGTTSDDTAISNAYSVSTNLLFTSGTYRFSLNATFASGSVINFESGAMFSVDITKTVTVRGTINAGWSQIFTGSGTVTGMKYARPRWWGAVGDATTDDASKIQAASNAVANSFGSDGTGAVIDFGRGDYLIGSTVTFYPQQNVSLRLKGYGVTGGQGTRITANSTFTGTSAVIIDGQTGALAPIADWEIDSIAIVAKVVGSGPSIGISIGQIDKNLSGVQMNFVKNLYVYGFTTGIRLAQVRLITFDRCSVWNDTIDNSKGVLITVDANAVASFTGDIVFSECQFVAANTGTKWNVHIENPNSGQLGIAGIKFRNCVFYHSVRGLTISAAAGCGISDVWVQEGCQFDGASSYGVYVDIKTVGAASYLSDFRVTDSYFQGISNTNIIFDVANNGSISNSIVANNWFNGSSGGAFASSATAYGVVVSDNICSDCDYGVNAIIEFNGVVNFNCTGNVLRRTGAQTCGYFISVQGGTADHFVISNNTAGGIPTIGVVRDLTGAVTKYLAGNI